MGDHDCAREMCLEAGYPVEVESSTIVSVRAFAKCILFFLSMRMIGDFVQILQSLPTSHVPTCVIDHESNRHDLAISH
jgi:hypothetical protein